MAKSTTDKLIEKLNSKRQERKRVQTRISRWQEQIKAEQERVRQIDSDIASLKSEIIMSQIRVSNLSLEQVMQLLAKAAQPDAVSEPESPEDQIAAQDREPEAHDASGQEPSESSIVNDSFRWPRGESGENSTL